MLFNSNFFDNTCIQGLSSLVLTDDRNGTQLFAPLKKTLLEGEISGPIADFSLTQIFAFGQEEIGDDYPVEAVYRFPLPGDAAVSEVSVVFGEVVIRTKLLPRKTAEKEYQEARENHRQAVLLTRESPDVFTLAVNGIKPGEEVRICTRFVQAGSPFRTGFSFRIPLTSAPRYTRSDERTGRHGQGNPLVTAQDPIHRFSICLKTVGSGTLQCSTHRISLSEGRYVLSDEEVIPNKDFEVVYCPQSWDHEISCQVYHSGGDESCLLALVTPPIVKQPRIPLDIIILVDFSGSMDGSKKSAAIRAVKQFLSRLAPEDLFNLCIFESDQYWLADNPVEATLTNLNKANHLLHANRSGGTELGIAIEQALYQSRASGLVSRHLLIITDAQVSDFGRIVTLVDEESERDDKRRCSVVCIDTSPNALLVRSISEKTGGLALFLKDNAENEDIADTIDDIYSAWEYIVAEGVSLSINQNQVISKSKVGVLPNGNTLVEIPPVGLSRSSWVMAKVDHPSETLQCSLSLPDGREISAVMYESPVVRKLVGAWIIQELEFLMHSGLTEDSIHRKFAELGIKNCNSIPASHSTVYVENSRKYLEKRLSQVIEGVSLEYGIVSSETAFFACREEQGKPVKTHVIVSSALPEGWSNGFDTSDRFRLKLTSDVQYARPHLARIKPPSCMSQLYDFASGPDFSFRHAFMPSHQDMITVASARSERIPEKKKEENHNKIVVYKGTPLNLDRRGELYNSDNTSEEFERIRKGTVTGLRIRVSGENYDKSCANSLIIEIYAGESQTPYESLTVKEFMRCGAYSWPDHDLIKERPIRIVIYDPKGVAANWVVLLEVEVSN